MTKKEIYEQIKRRNSFLCLGLDPDVAKMPKHLLDESDTPIYDFCKSIVDEVQHLCVAVKINT